MRHREVVRTSHHQPARLVGEERRLAEELGHESVDGPFVHLDRLVDLEQSTCRHHGHTITEAQGLLAVMRDQERSRVARS